MNNRVKEYQKFIDAMVEIRPCVVAEWCIGTGWPKNRENVEINKLLTNLNKEQKAIVAQMLQQARDGGIHDVLVYLTDEINVGELKISRRDIPLAIEPYGFEMYYDWISRRDGDDWPEEQLADEYKT